MDDGKKENTEKEKVDLKKEFSRDILIQELQENLKQVEDTVTLLNARIQQLDIKKQEAIAQLNSVLGKGQGFEELLQRISPEPEKESEKDLKKEKRVLTKPEESSQKPESSISESEKNPK